jgi:predicted metal-binding membrane protein
MPAMPSLQVLLKRDRIVLLASVFAITAVAWAYMTSEARQMYHCGVCCCAGMKMSGPDTHAWQTSTLLPLFLMWAEMMVGMMLPSAAPMILTFAAVNRKRHEQERPYVPTGIFVSGYLGAWTVFSALAAVAQWTLHASALLSPMMVSTSPLFAGVLLIAAGVFQWTSFKNSCLTHCRSPLGFLMTEWREGNLGALRMGLKHGIYCTGCCWFLMLLLFVAGVMNVWWIGLIAVFVLVEKLAPGGKLLARTAGVLLILWGGWMLFQQPLPGPRAVPARSTSNNTRALLNP